MELHIGTLIHKKNEQDCYMYKECVCSSTFCLHQNTNKFD